jgi:mycothiol synthase
VTADGVPGQSWHPLTRDDLTDLAALAGRVLAADGGLPLAAQPSFLSRRYAGDGVLARGLREPGGALLAAAAVRATPAGAVAIGMVDPAARGRGLGAALLDWALGVAGTPVTVETESLTGAAAALFGTRGLRQVFAEDVLRFDLAHPPPAVALPPGVRLLPWSGAVADRFFAVYAAAFAERPGFPNWPAQQWIDWLAGDDEFRPDLSLLAVEPDAGDVAFVACADGWIVQVGVRPDQRGRRLGAGLVVEALRRMRAAGGRQALLDVNVDNPAGGLYRRLGFEVVGRRARFAGQ